MGREISPTILIFLLLLFFMAVVYWVGTSSVGLSFAKAGQQIVYAIGGRTSSGQAVNYPQGTPTSVYSPTF